MLRSEHRKVWFIPPKLPGDARITFAPDNGEPEIHMFTVLGAYLIGDYDNDSLIKAGDVVTSLDPPVHGLPMAPPGTRLVNLYPAELPGDHVLTLQGTPGTHFTVDKPSGSGTAHLLSLGESLTNGLPAHVWLNAFTATNTGTATLTYTFRGTGAASNFTASASIKATVLGIKLQPVTTEIAEGGTAIVNPAVVRQGGLARYTSGLLPSGIADADIEWGIAQGSGNIVFNAGNNKGRSVVVRGMSAGDFKLQIDSIGGMTPDPKPYIYGKVLAETVTELHFFVLCDAQGNPCVSTNWIDNHVANANGIHAQSAMRFTRASITLIKNHPEWFIPADTAAVRDMLGYTSNVGGLEVYCVHRLPDECLGYTGHHLTPHPENGITIAENAFPNTLAHEICHACGLEDISYLGGTDLDGKLVSESLVENRNWSGGTGTGYYPASLLQKDLIKRLLMCVPADGTEMDIPIGPVKGYGVPDKIGWDVFRPREIGTGMMNREPRH